jgi:hypothetical protein
MVEMIGSFAATGASTKIVDADNSRGELVLQWISGDNIYLNFGAAAEAGKGVCLTQVVPRFTVKNHLASQAVYAIRSAVNATAGSYHTA